MMNIRFMKRESELFIGKGLLNVLEYLEERYCLDFVELERNRKS